MILASQSPRRFELLRMITEDFSVLPAMGDENIPEGTPPEQAVQLLAQQKAREIRTLTTTKTIIAADTVVAIDGKILGKPKDVKDAMDMLTLLSGRTHSVFTGVCVIDADGTEHVFAEETQVEFYDLEPAEIMEYVMTGEPMDKAGAYGIQERGALLVKRINGDYYNVMGLPIARLSRLLKGKE